MHADAQAYTSLALALRATPGHTRAHLTCAELLAAGGDHEQALSSLQAAWKAAPGDVQVQAALGAAMTDMGTVVVEVHRAHHARRHAHAAAEQAAAGTRVL